MLAISGDGGGKFKGEGSAARLKLVEKVWLMTLTSRLAGATELVNL